MGEETTSKEGGQQSFRRRKAVVSELAENRARSHQEPSYSPPQKPELSEKLTMLLAYEGCGELCGVSVRKGETPPTPPSRGLTIFFSATAQDRKF